MQKAKGKIQKRKKKEEKRRENMFRLYWHGDEKQKEGVAKSQGKQNVKMYLETGKS